MRQAPTILFVLFAAAALSFPVSDTDIWWHLAAGRRLVETVSWMRTDPFCLSSVGTPWTDLHWGFQILVYAWHRILGDAGLVVLRAALVIAALWIATRGRMGWGPAMVAMLVLSLTRTFLDLRPLLITMVALAALWRLLEGAPSPRRWTGAILLQILLANTQGLFLLGPLFALAAGVGDWIEGRKRAAVAHLGLVPVLTAASLANPWGWHAFDLAGKVAGRIVPTAANLFSREIPENLPLLVWLPAHHMAAAGLVWIGVFTWVFLRPGPGLAGRILLLVGTGLLSCMAVRNLPLFGLALMLSVEVRPVRVPWLIPVLGALLAAALSVPLLRERRWNDPSSWIAPLRLPSERTLAVLADHPGPVFHEIRVGGWLSWKLPDRNACWCDTRLVLHDAAFVSDYLDVLARPYRFDAWSRERGFRFALLPVAEMPHASPLASTLFASRSWKLLDCDGAWALFARNDVPAPGIAWATSVGKRAIESRIAERFHDNSRLECFASARLGEVLDQASQAIRFGGAR